MAPTRAFRPTSSENWAALARSPSRTTPVMPVRPPRAATIGPRQSAPGRAAAQACPWTSASAKLSASTYPEHLVVRALEPERRESGWTRDRARKPTPRSGWAGQRHRRAARAVGEERLVQDARLAQRVAGDVQVGAPDVADQERVAGENDPRLVACRDADRTLHRRCGPARDRASLSPARACCRARQAHHRRQARGARTRRRPRPGDTRDRRRALHKLRAARKHGRPARVSQTRQRSGGRPRRQTPGNASTRSACGSTTASAP